MNNHDCVPGSTDFCNPGCGPCTPPPPPMSCDPCTPPRPPMSCDYSHCHIPVPPPIAPICVPPIPGVNPAQQMASVIAKTNECINRWNHIQENCFAALNNVVGAAKSNDVYYDPCEVKMEQGYNTNDSAVYHIIRVNKFDRRGCPIRVRLGLAYDNATNSNVRQRMADFGFVKSSNAIMTAVAPEQTGWNGPAKWKGMQVPGNEATDKYIAGFNEFGVLKVYKGDITQTNLCQDKITDIIGACTPIVLDGEITAEAQALTTKQAVTAIGYNSGICQTVMFFTGCQDNPGMQGINVAQVMKDLGCTTAVITAMQGPDATNGSIGMAYLGRWTDAPVKYEDPENVAFWYVTKRPECGYKNDFETEIANLVQTTGMNANGITELRDKVETAQETADEALDLAQSNEDRIEVLENEVKELDERLTTAESNITELQNGLRQEIADRIAADNALGTRIDNEIQDRKNADAQLQNNIDQEEQAREAADEALQEQIGSINDTIEGIQGDITEINQNIENIINGSTQLEDYVKKTGDTMSGPLVLSGNQAANKAYVDAKLTNLPIATATSLGTVKVGSGLNITADGTLSATGGGGGGTGDYLPLSGGTMSGDIVMSDGTAVNLGSSGSLYNDNGQAVIKSETGNVVAMGQTFKVQTEGGAAVKVENVANGTAPSDAVNKGQLDTKADQTALDSLETTVEEKADQADLDALKKTVNGITSGTTNLPYVKKSGDTMTGQLVNNASIVVPDINLKKSNDGGAFPRVIATRTGSSTTVTGMNVGLYESNQLETGININDNDKGVHFNAEIIDGVPDPTKDDDAVNKKYVDEQAGNPFPDVPFLDEKWKAGTTGNLPNIASTVFTVTYAPKEILVRITGTATGSYPALNMNGAGDYPVFECATGATVDVYLIFRGGNYIEVNSDGGFKLYYTCFTPSSNNVPISSWTENFTRSNKRLAAGVTPTDCQGLSFAIYWR